MKEGFVVRVGFGTAQEPIFLKQHHPFLLVDKNMRASGQVRMLRRQTNLTTSHAEILLTDYLQIGDSISDFAEQNEVEWIHLELGHMTFFVDKGE